ncbi:MAG: YolD-like family protein [Clostridiales bacterium]|nr:YolD-like family protein [Clostridiales bacterium]
MVNRSIEEYQDIIHLPHFVSEKRAHMSMSDRAAQFSPFAALTGYGDAVKETARLTDRRPELDEDEKQILSEKLTLLQAHLSESPTVEITRFHPDQKKDGGVCDTVSGVVKKLDTFQRTISLTDGTTISFDAIVALHGTIFQAMEDSFA